MNSAKTIKQIFQHIHLLQIELFLGMPKRNRKSTVAKPQHYHEIVDKNGF